MRLSHVAWNLGGLALPLGVAVLTVPHLIETLGQERFGLLALAWGLLGYAGAMDLGLGRALTQMVARLRGGNNCADVPSVLRTTERITLISGVVGALLIALVAVAGGSTLITAHNTSQTEIQISMLLLAIALPAQAMSATYRGLNEAYLNFRGVSLLRAVLGIVNFAGPYAVSFFTTQLPWLIATLVVSRVLALTVYRHLAKDCLRNDPSAGGPARYSPVIARSLFSFGGWVTVSSVVSPILVQADRFVIASTISAAVVTVYVVPYEVVVQSLILVGAVSSVMFPGLCKLIQEKPNAWRSYFRLWLLRVTGLMILVCIAMALLLPVILPLWIKGGLQPESIRIGQVLCLGVFANAIGSMYYAQLHARGRADITAKLHLIELPLFVLALSFSIAQMGVMGAAWAWTGRMIVDSLALIWKARLIRA